jgi:hypothetical protein
LFRYLKHVQNITDSQCQPLPPVLQQTEIYPGSSATLIDYIAEPWKHNTQGGIETNLQHNPYYLFAIGEEYKYIQSGIGKEGMKMYCHTVRKEENSTMHRPSIKNWVRVQMLVASMRDD